MSALSQKGFENLIWSVTMSVLGLDPGSASEAVQKRVRVSWPLEDTGGGSWGRDENVVFIRAVPEDEDYTHLVDISHGTDENENPVEIVRNHRCWEATFLCYGPSADEDADKIRIGFLRASAIDALRENAVAPIPEFRRPLNVPEQDASGMWWQRVDVRIRFYELAEYRYSENEIENPPEITVNPA